jgi:hypothetical protein
MRTFKFLVIGVFILTMNSVRAQRDLILTQADEELRCRIIDETPVRFVFAYLKDGKPYRSEIFKTLVTSFKFDYYDADLPNADKLPEAMYRAIGGADPESPRALSSKSTSSKREKRNRKKSKEIVAEESLGESAELENERVEVEKSRTATSNNGKTKKPDEIKTVANNETSGNGNEKDAKVIDQSERIIDRTNKSTAISSQSEQKQKEAVNTAVTQAATKSATNAAPTQKTIEEIEDKKNDAVAGNTEGKLELEKAQEAEVTQSTNNSVPEGLVDISETGLPNITINQKNKFRIGIKGGIGNRLDNDLQTTNSFDFYQEQLLRGFTLGADIAYFPNDVIGFGAVFTDFKSRNSDSEIMYRNGFTGAEQVGSITNSRSVKFVGPALFLRKKLDYKTYVVLGLSPGYNFYNDKGSYDGVDYTFKGGGFGAASTLGIDFLLGNDVIGRDIVLSFEAGYNYGKIDALDYGDARGVVDLPTSIDLSRLDFTIGLRFIRFPKYFRLTSY